MAGFPEAKLTDEAKAFAVCAQACFDPPSVVAAAIRSEFNIQITPQTIEAYDPTKRAGRKLAEKWVALFETTRKEFLENTAAIPIANRAVRLRRLDRMSVRAEDKGNYPLAVSIIEQASKECGDVFTNKNRGNDSGEVVVRIYGGLPSGDGS
jgi:hypothetical protein